MGCARIRTLKSISQLGRAASDAASTGTTAVQLLRKQSARWARPSRPCWAKDHHEASCCWNPGRADAFVLDDNLLGGMIASSKGPLGLPHRGRTAGRRAGALLFRKDDPTFKAVVDGVLTKLMQSRRDGKIYTQWFVNPIPPKNMSLNLPLGTTLPPAVCHPNAKLETYQQ